MTFSGGIEIEHWHEIGWIKKLRSFADNTQITSIFFYLNIGVTQQAAPEPTHRTFRKRSRSRGQSIDRYLKLTAEQKCDIATRELEELREEIGRMKESAEKKMQNFRVCLFSLWFF